MFYCDACAERAKWPKTLFRSLGPCEICGTTAKCNDLPSRDLPVAPRSDPETGLK